MVSRPPIRLFTNISDAEKADLDYRASWTPEERLDLLFEIIHQHHEANGEASKRREKVFRLADL